MANTWFFIFLDCFLFPSKDSFFFFNGFTTVFVDKDRPQIDQNFQQEKKKETFKVTIAEDQKRKRTQKNFEKGKKTEKNKKEKNKI